MTSYLIVLPSIYPPYMDACLGGMAPDLREHLLVVDNTERNRGLAASWGIGAQRVLDEGLDWLVILSAAVRFGPTGGRDFVALLEAHDPTDVWVVESQAPVNQHLMAWSRPMLESVGLPDENFWPIYGEDADFSRRVHIAQAEGWGGRWVNRPVDAWITMAGHSSKLAGVKPNMVRTWVYYERKWGGLSGHETYSRPFNDPDLSLSFWPVPPHPLAVEHEGWHA